MSEEIEVYRCKDCGWLTSAEPKGAIGTAHAHAEKHTGKWGLPPWLIISANPEELDKHIEKLTLKVVDGDTDD